MRFLGISDRRTWKLREPLMALSDNNVVVSISENTIRGYYKLFNYASAEILKNNPDVLIANGDGVAAFICCYLGDRHGIPTILQIGGDCWRDHRKRIDRSISNLELSQLFKHLGILGLNKSTFDLVDGCFAVSNKVRREILSNTKLSPTDIEIVETPVKTALFMRRDYTSSSSICTVTNLGYLDKANAIKDAMVGISEVMKENKELEYQIVGDGQFKPELEDYITTHFERVCDRVQFVGYVSDISSVYENSSIFVYPSYEDGLPSTVLEAQATGLPVITNCGEGMDDQIIHGESGYFVEWTDSKSVRNTLTQLLNSEKKRKTIGENSKERIQRTNSIDSIGRSMNSATKRLISHSE